MSKYALGLLASGLATNTRLTDFFFTHNNLEEFEDAGKTFLKSFENKRELRSLALNSCNMNNNLLLELQSAIQDHTKLQELYLFANKINSDGAKHISAIIKNKSFLSSIGLSNNKLYKAGAVEIADNGLKGKNQLVKISIENNSIGNEGLQAISHALGSCSGIQELYLYNNEIDDEPIDAFCTFLKNQSQLVALGLEFNRIGYKGLQKILEAIVDHHKLEKLYLNQNDINTQAGESLYAFISNIKNLKELRISNN